MQVLGLKDRRFVSCKVGWHFGRVWEHEHPSTIAQLAPPGRGNSEESHQALNSVPFRDLNGGQQEIRQKLSPLPDRVNAKVGQSTSDGALFVIDDAARDCQFRGAAIHV